ncbi:MAG: SDR family oxidoreductase [Bdellovibrionaceae bacterium]|nr:SDR family oxidoreductase [Pseudobdellovibrionaceae bacterium]
MQKVSHKTSQPHRKPKPPFPAQKQKSPGLEWKMNPRPKFTGPDYRPAGKLFGKKALIAGGDSGIGRAVAILYAREGADVAITYLPIEKRDAQETQTYVEALGRRCVLIEGDLSKENFCQRAVEKTVTRLGAIDILVSNAAHQMRKDFIDEITSEEWDKTFKTNVYAYFHLVKTAVKYMKPGSSIIATSSETASKAPKELLDYSATKGAINTLTKSLAQMLIDKQIRVNAVAPGPVWSPLNISDEGTRVSKVKQFGKNQPIQRPAQPEEVAPAYVFLASEADSSYITGAILAETGGFPVA